MAKNKVYVKLIHTSRWVALRRAVLTEHPICQECERKGLLSPAKEVHHIVPVEKATSESDMNALMYDRHNLMALCRACHVRLHTELGKASKADREINRANQLERFRVKFFGGEEGGGVF